MNVYTVHTGGLGDEQLEWALRTWAYERLYKRTTEQRKWRALHLINSKVLNVGELILLCHPWTRTGLELSLVTNFGPSMMLSKSRSLVDH